MDVGRDDAGAIVIQVAGEWWATASEVAEHIGHGLTVGGVRRWADRDGLITVRSTDEHGRPQVRYLLGQAVWIERSKRQARCGRPRAA
jgi:hypothetical protein